MLPLNEMVAKATKIVVPYLKVEFLFNFYFNEYIRTYKTFLSA
jgi:hypothetical protein